MTNDKELVEVWRSEFETWYDAHTKFNWGVAYYFGSDGKYCFADVDLAWQSFLSAKRTQPSVVLPKAEWKDAKGHSYQVMKSWEVMKSLATAGIKYTIGE